MEVKILQTLDATQRHTQKARYQKDKPVLAQSRVRPANRRKNGNSVPQRRDNAMNVSRRFAGGGEQPRAESSAQKQAVPAINVKRSLLLCLAVSKARINIATVRAAGFYQQLTLTAPVLRPSQGAL
jgi:hypothetical protein